MADSTNISVFGQEVYFNEKVNAFKEVETPILNTTELNVENIATFGGTGFVKQLFENANVSSTALTGTINLDILSGTLFYYTQNASNNWTFNVRGNSSTSLNSILPVGKSVIVTILSTQGSSPKYASDFKIDGASISPKWQDGIAPTSVYLVYPNSINVYTYAILKTADATFTVIASLTRFS
jgi:hypothetical protein